MSTTNLLPLLSALGPNAISGEHLARQLHLSRTAVWKQIRTLSKLGLPIRVINRRGYALDNKVDLSLGSFAIKKAPLKHWVQPHYELFVPSTQRLALHAAQNGVPEGHFWMAEVQSEGRGRLDRPWSSGFGGLWVSLVLRPQVAPSRGASIGLVAALQWIHVLEKKAKIKARLKWPNDIVIPTAVGRKRSFKKLGGFLTQMSGEVDKTDWIVLGMGINVLNTIPKSLEDTAVNLSLFSGQRSELLGDFFSRFYSAYRTWQRQGFAAFQEEYWSCYGRPNEPCLVKTAQGEIRGIARHVDASGAFIIESRRKMHTVFEGEITL